MIRFARRGIERALVLRPQTPFLKVLMVCDMGKLHRGPETALEFISERLVIFIDFFSESL